MTLERQGPGKQVYGSGSQFVYDCQWPGCRDIAGHRASRSVHVRPLCLCERHLLAFRDLLDVQALMLSATRQPERRRRVARSHVPWLLGIDDDDD